MSENAKPKGGYWFYDDGPPGETPIFGVDALRTALPDAPATWEGVKCGTCGREIIPPTADNPLLRCECRRVTDDANRRDV